MTRQQRKKEVFWFVFIAFAFSWICWTPVALSGYGILDLGLHYPKNWFYDFAFGLNELTLSHWLTVAGGFGPLIGATVVVWRFRGQPAVKELWGRVFSLSLAPPHWYLIAFLIPIGLSFVSTYLSTLSSGEPMVFGSGPLDASTVLGVVKLFLLSVAAMTVLIVCEELGWRGFLQRWLQRDMSALWAAFWIAILWAYWHFPYYLLLFNPDPGNPETFMSALMATLLSPVGFIPLTIFFSFVFNSSRGSILVVMIMHGANNSSARLFGVDPNQATVESAAASPIAEWGSVIAAVFPYVAAALLVVIVGARTLSRQKPQAIDSE